MAQSRIPPLVLVSGGAPSFKPRFPRSPHPLVLASSGAIPKSPLRAVWTNTHSQSSESDSEGSSYVEFLLVDQPLPSSEAALPLRSSDTKAPGLDRSPGEAPVGSLDPPLSPPTFTDHLPKDKQGMGRKRAEELVHIRKTSPIIASGISKSPLRNQTNSPERPPLVTDIAHVKCEPVQPPHTRANFLERLFQPPSRSPTIMTTPVTPPDSAAEFHFSLPSPGMRSPLSAFEEEGFSLESHVERLNWAQVMAIHNPEDDGTPSPPAARTVTQVESAQSLVAPPRRLQSLHNLLAARAVGGRKSSSGLDILQTRNKSGTPPTDNHRHSLGPQHHLPPASASGHSRIPPVPCLTMNSSTPEGYSRPPHILSVPNHATSHAEPRISLADERSERGKAMKARLGMRRSTVVTQG